jgi:hypothetical protein
MGRRPSYNNADDLIKHCEIKDGCILWPQSDSSFAAVLSPASPLAQAMRTNSVARILFVLCRYLPAGRRLVRRCNSPTCVNPYHYTEANFIMRKRAGLKEQGLDPQSLLPKQESSRHLAYPPDDVINARKPIDPEVLGVLMMSASVAGFDAKGLPSAKKYEFGVPLADPTKPLLVIKQRKAVVESEEPQDDATQNVDDFFDALEESLSRQMNPRKYGMEP